jgi:hypothetical protein
MAFYGASRQDTPPLDALRSRFDGQRSFSPSPGTVACGVRWKGRGWLSPVAGRDSGVYRSRFVLRSRAGTILLSGALGPIASFGSPGGHSLSRGTRARGPGPAIQWMLSPEPLGSRDRHLGATSFPPLLRPGSTLLRRFLGSLRVVDLLGSPHRQHDGCDLPHDGELRQVRLSLARSQLHALVRQCPRRLDIAQGGRGLPGRASRSLDAQQPTPVLHRPPCSRE